MPAHAGIHDFRGAVEKARTSFLKKRSKKLLPTAGCGDSVARAPRKSKVFWLLFFKKVTASFLLSLSFFSLAAAQSYPTDPASAGNCPAASAPKTPGDGPGGNVFATHINAPQPLDLPNNESATYPDIEADQPDQFPLQPISPDNLTYPPFPFSGSINNPVLTQSAPESTANPSGC